MAASVEQLIQDPDWRSKIAAARKAGHSYEDIEARLRERGVLDTGTTTTTTPTTTTPLTGLVQATSPASVLRFGARNPAMTGQVLGGAIGAGLAPETGGLSLAIPAALGFLGGVGGSAIQRGGVPTPGDVATAAAGEALPLVPGAGRAGASFVRSRLGPQVAERLAQSARFGIPKSAVEVMEGPIAERVIPGLARSPVSSRMMLRAGRAQSSAIREAADAIGARFGGVPLPEFGRAARKGILATAQRLSPGKGPEMLAAAKQLAGDTVQAAALADLAAKKPLVLAQVMRTVGEQGMNDLRTAWWTSVLESATAKQGLRKGILDPRRVVAAFDGLGAQGASALFGRRAPLMRDFVESLRTARTAAAAGTPIHIPFRWQFEIPAAIAGMLFGQPTKAGGVVAVEAVGPWLAGKLLVTGPPGAASRLLAPVAPTLARVLVQSGVSEASAAEMPPGMPSTELPGPQQRPGDYRPQATARLSDRTVSRRTAIDVARDRDYLERIDSDLARQFAAENPDAGREDYLRWRRKRGLDR